MRAYCTAQGTLLNALGNLNGQEIQNEGWLTLLYSRNLIHVVKQPYFSSKNL